jgi:hypothetical protein
MKKLLLATILTALLLASVRARAAEEAPHQVVRSYDGFELRRYDSYLVAETRVSGSFDSAAFQAFSRLFNYIDGDNVRRESIAMTAPVVQEPAPPGEKIPMTAPVLQGPETGAGGNFTVGFVMPAGYTLQTVPAPLDPRVTIREVPARLMAARAYSGSWGRWAYGKNQTALLEAVDRAGFKTVGDPIFARYNHPLTRPSQRRNEVLIEVREK